MRDTNENHPKTGSTLAEISRALSLLLALACLVAAYFSRNGETFHLAVTVVVLPLGCIWYGNEIGSFTGMSANGEEEAGNVVGALITIGGWAVLLAMLAFSAFGSSR